MKNPSIRPNHNKAFCSRCFKFNGKCPKNGTKVFALVDRSCTL